MKNATHDKHNLDDIGEVAGSIIDFVNAEHGEISQTVIAIAMTKVLAYMIVTHTQPGSEMPIAELIAKSVLEHTEEARDFRVAGGTTTFN